MLNNDRYSCRMYTNTAVPLHLYIAEYTPADMRNHPNFPCKLLWCMYSFIRCLSVASSDVLKDIQMYIVIFQMNLECCPLASNCNYTSTLWLEFCTCTHQNMLAAHHVDCKYQWVQSELQQTKYAPPRQVLTMFKQLSTRLRVSAVILCSVCHNAQVCQLW